MARKSASQAKIKKPEFKQPELPPIEETFEKAKQAFVNTLEVSVQLGSGVILPSSCSIVRISKILAFRFIKICWRS